MIWYGTATSTSPIVHGEGTEGNVALQRVMPIWSERLGRIVEVPYVAGNAIRGVLRDTGAELAYEWLGRPTLSGAAVHALASGGSLAKATKPLTSREEERLKALIPHCALFGLAGGGRIMSGALSVGMMIPRCFELDGETNPRVGELTTEMFGTRHARLPAGLAVAADDDHEGDQMIYEFQAIPAGVEMSWSLVVDGGVNHDAAENWLRLVLDKWSEKGAHVAAKGSTGYGGLSIPTLPGGGVLPEPLSESDTEEALELLGRL